MAVIGFHKLETLFRKAASLDIAKGHAKEITDIIGDKLYDLLIIGERNAKYNGREVIWECDIPLTKGILETLEEFKKLEEELDLKDILDHLATLPPLKYPLETELEEKLPEITGAILVVLARIMKSIDEENRRVNHELIEKAKRIIDLTL